MRQCVNEKILNFFRYFDFNWTSLTYSEFHQILQKVTERVKQGTDYDREFCDRMREKNDRLDRN